MLYQKFWPKIVNVESGSNGGLHFLTFLIGGVAFAGGYYAFQKYRRRLIPTPTQYIGQYRRPGPQRTARCGRMFHQIRHRF